jgi:hypothetical protein
MSQFDERIRRQVLPSQPRGHWPSCRAGAHLMAAAAHETVLTPASTTMGTLVLSMW